MGRVVSEQSCGEGWGNSSATTHWDLNGHIGTPGNTSPRGVVRPFKAATPRKGVLTLRSVSASGSIKYPDSPCAPGQTGA